MTEVKRPSIEGAPVVGVTGTYYDDLNDVRFEIALDTAAEWNKRGLPLVVVDASPADEFTGKRLVASALRARGAIVLAACVAGIASQHQKSLAQLLRCWGMVIQRMIIQRMATQLLSSDGQSIRKNQCRHSSGVPKNWLAGCLSVR